MPRKRSQLLKKDKDFQDNYELPRFAGRVRSTSSQNNSEKSFLFKKQGCQNKIPLHVDLHMQIYE